MKRYNSYKYLVKYQQYSILDKAYREQGACYNPKQIIVDKVMEEKLNTLKIAVTKLKKENIKLTLQNEELLKEIERLKLQLEKK